MGENRNRLRSLGTILLALIASTIFCAGAQAIPVGPGTTFGVSWLDMEPGSIPGANSGSLGMGASSSPSSSDGRYVLFTSNSTNLAEGGNPNNINAFRKDMQTGDVVLVNRLDGVNGASTPGQFYSFDLSGDGNRAILVTPAQWTADDTDTKTDVYLRDIAAGTTTLISPGTTEDVDEAVISANGAFIAFTTSSALVGTDLNGTSDAYRYRIADGNVDLVSRADGVPNAADKRSTADSISGDGRWVSFSSRAGNLIPGFVDNNGDFSTDIYVRDMDAATNYLVSTRFNAANQGANGESYESQIAGSPAAVAEVKVAFTSYGTNLADNGISDPDPDSSLYLKTVPATASELISRASGPGGASADSRAHTASISDDASKIVFSSDAGNLGAGDDYYGVYMRNRADNTTRLVSARNEYAVWGAISADGSQATWPETGGATPDSDRDLTGVFRRNLATDQIELVSRPKGTAKVVAPGFSNYSMHQTKQVFSENGRYLVFGTASSHLPGGGDQTQQIYRRDLTDGKIELVSRADGIDGTPSEGSDWPAVTPDGRYVAFATFGPLDPADTNDRGDVYVRDMVAGTTRLVSRADGVSGAVSDEGATGPSISADGNLIAFTSEATNLGYPGPDEMVYVRNMSAADTELVSRATGEAGAAANNNSSDPMISDDGSRIIFRSSGTNLSPDDAVTNGSAYLRDLSSKETILVSRAPGLAGASLPGFVYDMTLSADGTKAAFVTSESAAVPATAPWPAFIQQIVLRSIADGTNQLVSSSTDGLVGDGDSSDPSLNRDGTIVAFGTDATNLRSDVDIIGLSSVVLKDLVNGTTSGPPLFGAADAMLNSSFVPEISRDGNCVAFLAEGHNAISGDLGSFQSTYVYVNKGTCEDPRVKPPAVAPTLTAVSLKPFKFHVAKKATAKVAAKKRKKKRTPAGTKIRFKLNTEATVRIRVDRKAKGKKAGKKCVKPTRKNRGRKNCKRLKFQGKLVRRNQAGGKRVVPFSGRIGKRALKPGKYRVVIQAVSPAGSSAKVYRSFRIVRK